MNASRGKILVIRGGAIGDFILTLPAIAALRKNFPDAYLEVLGYPHIAQLALAGGLVDRVESIGARALAGFFARGGELAEELVDYFCEFDLILPPIRPNLCKVIKPGAASASALPPDVFDHATQFI